MNNQKDTQKNNLNSYGQTNVLDVKTLNNKPVYEFASKKTEKLVTALYMVTDCMDTDDALKGKLRQLGVELLSDMYNLSSLSPMDKYTHIASSVSRVYEILSFVEIAYTIGFISEMNTSILKKEFSVLIMELENYQKKDKHFTFTLDRDMFETPKIEEENNSIKKDLAGINSIKDKRTSFNNMSFMNSNILKTNNLSSSPKLHSYNITDKKERVDKILALITSKEVSIKDISNSFMDCSEKTIQRELNALVSKGQIKKTGSKRWSRYSVISK